jgi:hypothetical protein
MSEWIDPQDWPEYNKSLVVAARRDAYERRASALWADLKTSIRAAVDATNSQAAHLRRIECGDSQTALTLTHFQYPLVLLDLTIDVESGMIGGLYTYAAQQCDPYREQFRVWLIRTHDTNLVLNDSRGRAVPSLDEMAQQVIAPYLASLGES